MFTRPPRSELELVLHYRRAQMPLRSLRALAPLLLACFFMACEDAGTTPAPATLDPPPAIPPPDPEPESGPGVDILDFPLRALAAAGHWEGNRRTVAAWETRGKAGALIPADYQDWLASLHVNWVQLSVSLHYDDSVDSTVERKYSPDVVVPTFSDDALRQIIREFREHGVNVYLTLAFESREAEKAARPVQRWQLGDPAPPETGGVPPGDPAVFGLILPENWPWRPDHPDHERFVAEFWETYTEQAVHFARIAEDEGVPLFSLGTETDRLFRTRPAVDPYMSNDFGDELRSMVNRVRAVYNGWLTYDAHIETLISFHHFGRGSAVGHLWEDLDLDIVGLSGWFSLADSPPTSVMSIQDLEPSYERIFRDYLVPLTSRNPGRAVVFTEYGAMDVVEAPAEPWNWSREGEEFVFSDLNDNGLDDGRETQSNIFQAFFNTVERYPGVVNGAFFWNNWIASDAMWEENWANERQFSIRGRPAEAVVRAAYRSYAQDR